MAEKPVMLVFPRACTSCHNLRLKTHRGGNTRKRSMETIQLLTLFKRVSMKLVLKYETDTLSNLIQFGKSEGEFHIDLFYDGKNVIYKAGEDRINKVRVSIVVRQFFGSRFPAWFIDLTPTVRHLGCQPIVWDFEWLF